MNKILLIFLTLLMSLLLKAEEKKPLMVFIKAGSVLTNILDHTLYELPKEMIAKVLAVDADKKTYQVLDKNNLPRYLVELADITSLEDDLKILPTPFEPSEKTSSIPFRPINTFAAFDSEFIFALDSLKISELNEIYQSNSSNVWAPKFEARTIYHSDILVDFGITLNHQNANLKSDIQNETVRFSFFSFGPIISYPLLIEDDFKMEGLASLEIIPYFDASSVLYQEKYTGKAIDIGIENEWKRAFGTIQLGAHLKHREINLTESNRINLDVLSKKYTLNSWGIMIGYKLEWQL